MFDVTKPGLRRSLNSNLLNSSLNSKTEFEFYLHIITQKMDPNGSFLELGPESSSLSDYLKDVTILSKNTRVLKRYVAQKRKIIHGDYLSLTIPDNSFDYVVAINPNLYNSENCIQWLDSEKNNFKFKDSHLEDFVLSLFNIARKKVFIASKAIADNLPIKKFARMIGSSPYFVLYEKPISGGKNGKS